MKSVAFKTMSSQLRNPGSFNIGTTISNLAGGSEGIAAGGAEATKALGGLAAVAGPAIVALAGVAVAAKLVEAGFQAIQYTATELLGAVAKIGGAKGLQEMFVESVSNDKLINQARNSVDDSEALSKRQMNDIANRISENASAGAFSKSDILKGYKEIGTLTGQQGSISESTMGFLGKYALVGNMDYAKSAGIFGKIKASNPNMTDEDIQNSMLAAHAVGKKGSFSPDEIPDANKLMQLQGKLAGNDGAAKLATLFTIGTLTKTATGSLDISGTQTNSWLKGAYKAAEHGDKTFKFNQAGQLTNINDAMIAMVNNPMDHISKYARAGKGLDFITNLRQGVSLRAGVSADDTSKEASEARAKVIREFEKLGMTQEQFEEEVQRSITPQEQMQAAFHKMTNGLEEEFLPVMKLMVPVVQSFAAMMLNKKDELGNWFISMVGWIQEVVFVIPSVISMLLAFGRSVVDVIHQLTVGIKFMFPVIGAKFLGATTLDEAQHQVKKLEADRDDIKKGIDADSTGKDVKKLEDAENAVKAAKDTVAAYQLMDDIKSGVIQKRAQDQSKQFQEDLKQTQADREAAAKEEAEKKAADSKAADSKAAEAIQEQTTHIRTTNEILAGIHANTYPALSVPSADSGDY